MPEPLKGSPAAGRHRLLAGLRRLPAGLSAYVRTLFAPGLSPGRRAALVGRGVGALARGAFRLLLAYALALVPLTPSIDNVRKARDERPSVLLAADGTPITRFRRVNREWIPLERVPQHVIDALIATEDMRFWQHAGIDWSRSLAAAGFTLLGDRQGGSTLTQQLARNLFPDEIGHAPTATRKLKELITAFKLEHAYSKREILETYLNTVPFLYNAFGIEMAARTYFDKPARELSVLEGATLVGMLKGTAAYNPVLNPERAVERRNVVLSRMVKAGKLSPKAYAQLERRPLAVDFKRQDGEIGIAPHFAEAVRRWLLGWAEERGYDIYADGLVIQSTLDPKLQHLASQALGRQLDALQAVADVEWGQASGAPLSVRLEPYRDARRHVEPFRHFWSTHAAVLDDFVRESPEFARLVADGASEKEALAQLRADTAFMKALRARKTRLESGFVAIDPRGGEVRAWVGSRNFATDRFDHVLQARRQPGSTFKPFVYGAALEQGMDPEREFQDRAVTIRLPGGQVWQPQDMGGPSGRSMRLEDGLVYSRNSVTAQVIDQVGAAKVVKFAQRLGVRDSPLEAVPSLALGTSPVTLLEMVGAYGTIAALGEYRPPLLVTRISDRRGKVLGEFGSEPEQALKREVAIDLIEMMRGVVDRGTGRNLRSSYGIRADVAGKTGTTQNNTDGWFILMHPQLVVGSWVGFNDQRVTLRSSYWGQGAHNALHVVGDFMRQALAVAAIDPGAEFPHRERGLVAVLSRAGARIKEWLGIEDPPPPPQPAPLEPPLDKARREAEDVLEHIVNEVQGERL